MDQLDFIHHPLATLGRTLPADQDHPLAQTHAGALLLIHIPPGDYPFEVHRSTEYLLCMQGRLVLEGEGGQRADMNTGEMLEIPPGLKHRFASESDAVIVTLVQKPAA